MFVGSGSEDRILIIDFGSQYTQLIARRVREMNVYCEIHVWQKADGSFLRSFLPHGIILSGGPESTLEQRPPSLHPEVFNCGVPVLGICYGMQAMAGQLGGAVESSEKCEFGRTTLRIIRPGTLFAGMGDQLSVWMSHGDKVLAVPAGFTVTAGSANSPIAAMADESRRFYGLQFHPEVVHTVQGTEILRRFIVDAAGCRQTWKPASVLADQIDTIRRLVGDEEVILGLSGGVDSSVAALLIHRAIGKRLHCVFVNNGLLRVGEAEQVVASFQRCLDGNLIHVDAGDRFFRALKNVHDPEEKRRVIGAAFVDVFQEEAQRLTNVCWLAQGTIYPDVIESAAAQTAAAHVIKSHHNVGGLPEHLHLKLLEPLSQLFKDEVRRIGHELGLSDEIIYRHPFPGPSLAVRVLGAVKKEYVEILRQADHIYIEELKAHGLYNNVAQAFAVFLPVKSVAVMGDRRDYSYVIALRAVETTDFMTAKRANLPAQFLDEVAGRIINEVRNVSRVCYDISSKPPATIEWE